MSPIIYLFMYLFLYLCIFLFYIYIWISLYVYVRHKQTKGKHIPVTFHNKNIHSSAIVIFYKKRFLEIQCVAKISTVDLPHHYRWLTILTLPQTRCTLLILRCKTAVIFLCEVIWQGMIHCLIILQISSSYSYFIECRNVWCGRSPLSIDMFQEDYINDYLKVRMTSSYDKTCHIDAYSIFISNVSIYVTSIFCISYKVVNFP